jgi:hypothetical protein
VKKEEKEEYEIKMQVKVSLQQAVEAHRVVRC